MPKFIIKVDQQIDPKGEKDAWGDLYRGFSITDIREAVLWALKDEDPREKPRVGVTVTKAKD